MSKDIKARIHTQINQAIAVKQGVLNDQKITEQIQFLAEACLS